MSRHLTQKEIQVNDPAATWIGASVTPGQAFGTTGRDPLLTLAEEGYDPVARTALALLAAERIAFTSKPCLAAAASRASGNSRGGLPGFVRTPTYHLTNEFNLLLPVRLAVRIEDLVKPDGGRAVGIRLLP